jgi:hypothetical protein
MKNANAVNVNRNNVVTDSEIRSGNSVFRIVRGEKGVSLQYRKASVSIPNGAIGQAIVAELSAMVGGSAPAVASAPAPTADKPKRTRRTKAQMEAARLAETQGAGDAPATDAPATSEDTSALDASLDAELNITD